MIQHSRLFEIVRSFLTYSFKEIDFDYTKLTWVEQKHCTAEEFAELVRWLKDEPLRKTVKFADIDPEDGCLMTRDEFVLGVGSNAFTDDDGFGELATENQVSDEEIHPSWLVRPEGESGFNWPDWATHVLWYNK